MSQFHRHEPETAELLEAFEMLGQLASMPSERPDVDWDVEQENPEVIEAPPYPAFCLHPEQCAGKSCCPRPYSCSE